MVIGDILKSHEHLVVCMDATSRNVRWDNSCIGVSHGQKSVKMGIKLEEIMDKYSLHIHNNGQFTYSSGNVRTAPDVTLSTGIHKFGNIKWCIIDDDLNTPHEGILFDVGEQSTQERKEVIDWKSFQWKQYKEESGSKLSELKERWISDPLSSCDEIVKELDECISECVEKVAVKKVVLLRWQEFATRSVAVFCLTYHRGGGGRCTMHCVSIICPVPFPSRLITTHTSTAATVVNNMMFYNATRSSWRRSCDRSPQSR